MVAEADGFAATAADAVAVIAFAGLVLEKLDHFLIPRHFLYLKYNKAGDQTG